MQSAQSALFIQFMQSVQSVQSALFIPSVQSANSMQSISKSPLFGIDARRYFASCLILYQADGTERCSDEKDIKLVAVMNLPPSFAWLSGAALLYAYTIQNKGDRWMSA
jgi:hypothetical protein